MSDVIVVGFISGATLGVAVIGMIRLYIELSAIARINGEIRDQLIDIKAELVKTSIKLGNLREALKEVLPHDQRSRGDRRQPLAGRHRLDQG